MTDWNDDLRDMFERVNTDAANDSFKEWVDSLSDDDYLDYVIGKLEPPSE